MKHTLRIVSASSVSIDVNTALFDFAQLEQSDAERSGTVGTLNVTSDTHNIEPLSA